MLSHPQAVSFRLTNILFISSQVTGFKYNDSMTLTPIEFIGDFLVIGMDLAKVGLILMKKLLKYYDITFLSSVIEPSLSLKLDWMIGFWCLLIIFLIIDHDFLVLSLWDMISSL